MLPRNPLQQLTPPRLRKALERVREMIWRDLGEVTAVSRTRSTRDHLSFDEARKAKRTPVTRTPHHWGRMFDQVWFKVELPPARRGDGTRYLQWRDQGEATVYVDGVPWYGLDPGHQRAPLPPKARVLWVEATCARTGIWVTGEAQGISEEGSAYHHPRLLARDDLAWEVYHDFLVLYETLALEYNGRERDERFGEGFAFRPPVYEMSPRFRRMMGMLDDAVAALNTDGLPAMKEKLAAIYAAFPIEAGMPECILTGHAHIDLVWLWPERVGDFKAVHTFATMSRILEQYPETRFGYSQPASYEAVARRSPKLMKRVHGLITKGVWEPTGAAYVESDTQLPCGEALARSVVLGQEGFRELTGKASTVLWLPDVFGYSPCLPQILKGAGVDHFFTTKLAWSNITRFPHSSFVWRGNDGSEVTAHILQSCGYNTEVLPKQLKRTAETFQQADIHGEYLLPTGYGDGGGGVTEEMCERARRVRDLAGLPPAKWGRIDKFFARMDRIRDRLPVYQGEVYLEYHRGVQTTHALLKNAFRAAERALQTWEAAHSVLGCGPVDTQAWKRVVFAQFHDYIPGSSIQEVYDEAIPELHAITEKAGAATARSLTSAKGSDCLFNPVPHERPVVMDGDGGSSVHLLPALSGVGVAESRVELPRVEVSDHRLVNERVCALFDGSGRVRSLTVDGHTVAFEGEGAGLLTFPDHPALYEAWDIDRPDLAQSRPPAGPCRSWIEEDNGVRAMIAYEQALSEKSSVVTYYTLSAGESVLRVRYKVDWHDYKSLLKLALPTPFKGSRARYGTPFGSTLRAAQPGRPSDEAAFEVPASRWAVATDDSGAEGLFVVTEAKYGFGCQSGLLHVSLLRSAFVTRAGENRALRQSPYGHDYSDIGTHDIRLAVGRFDACAPRADQPAMLADTLFTAPLLYRGAALDAGFGGFEGGDSLIPAWAKPLADGSWVLRLHETLGKRGQARLRLASGLSAHLVDLEDEPVPGGNLRGGTVEFTPYSLLGVRIVKKTQSRAKKAVRL
ncbi:MAG: alpha-mannosidase [Opitutales bacterium]|nr:alpha-mannosidase [Opitutales bacterium]